MKIQDFAGTNENVCILGFGKEGKATLEVLMKNAPDLAYTIADQNPEVKHKDIPVLTGPDYLEKVEKGNFKWIIRSPGIPPHPLFDTWKKEGRLITGTQIFLDSVKDSGAIVIGVTGSKGKSTTSSLIFSILKAAGKNVQLIGNIGEPAISHIADASPTTIFVSEMSSYQLADLTTSPHIAVVTSFFPEHLDYHGSEQAYKDAKKNIARFQTKDDTVLFDATSEGAKEIASEGKGKKIPFSVDETHTISMNLIGKHNERNVAAALAVAALPELSVEQSIALSAVRAFTGLPHRLEYCGEHAGIRFYEDSISTTPESTIAAIDALNDEIDTIILGGLDRGYDFTELGKKIAESSVKNVILFPESGARIKAAIEAAKANVEFFETEKMDEAVAFAKQKTQPGKVCVLSPASPSYNLYKNFEERGEAFKQAI